MQVNKITSPIAKLMLIDDMGYKKAEMPTKNRPYCIFDQNKVDVFVKNGERAVPKLTKMLQKAKTEDEIVEGLYIADRMIDGGVKNMGNLYYPAFSRFNDSRSANVQTFLSGVYRKTLNPDAFGPLVKMMCDNFKDPPKANFDPNEEVGGAVIEYLRDAVKQSKNNK
ncbi:hypothetical protein IJ843_07715 [bacterium]|nr:hypothetical protein [bacterium]